MTKPSESSAILDALANTGSNQRSKRSALPAVARIGLRAFASLVIGYVSVVLSAATSTFAIVGVQPNEPGLSVAVGGYLAILGGVFAAVLGPVVYAVPMLAVAASIFAVTSLPKCRSITVFTALALVTVVGAIAYGYAHPSHFLDHVS